MSQRDLLYNLILSFGDSVTGLDLDQGPSADTRKASGPASPRLDAMAKMPAGIWIIMMASTFSLITFS